MGFRSLQHIKAWRSTCRGLCLNPLRSAFRVWLPSWRLAPAEPVPVLFHTGGAHGIHPSELSPHGRYSLLSRTSAPTCRFAHRYSRRRSVGPAPWAAAPGFLPFRESLAAGRGLAHPTTGGSLGFHPPRAFQRQPCPGFHPNSSHALCERGRKRPRPPAPRSLIDSRLAPPDPTGKPDEPDRTTLTGSLHQHDPRHSRRPAPGLWIRLMPRRASLPTGRQSLGLETSLYRSCPGVA
jgi:hypothetical protein